MPNSVLTPDADEDYVSYASGLERHFQETGERLALPERPVSLKHKIKKLIPDGLRKRDSRPKSSTLHHAVQAERVLPEPHDDPPIPPVSDEVLIISTPETRAARKEAEDAAERERREELAAYMKKLREQADVTLREWNEKQKREVEVKAQVEAMNKRIQEEKELEKLKGKGKSSEEDEDEEVEFESYENNPFFPQDDGIIHYDRELRIYTNKVTYDGNLRLYSYKHYL